MNRLPIQNISWSVEAITAENWSLLGCSAGLLISYILTECITSLLKSPGIVFGSHENEGNTVLHNIGNHTHDSALVITKVGNAHTTANSHNSSLQFTLHDQWTYWP